LLGELYRCAVDSVDGARILARHAAVCEGEWRFEREGRTLNLALPAPHSGGRLRLIGIGKAAAALAEGVIASLSERHRPDDVLLIVNEASRAQATRLTDAVPHSALTIHVGEHPLPGPASEAAGRALIEFIGTPRVEDRYMVMLSGGASALCAAPVSGLTLADKQRATELTLRSGAPIEVLNALRRILSTIKGGGLARRMAPARFVTVAISDVRGDDPTVIGSAPTVECARDPHAVIQNLQARGVWTLFPASVRTVLQHSAQGAPQSKPPAPVANYAVIASLDDALRAVQLAARRRGLTVHELGRTLYDSTSVHAVEWAERLCAQRPMQRERDAGPELWLAGGEPVVTVRGRGRGGRAQHLALQVAERIDGAPSVCLLAAGTDGRDGPTDAAGGFADGGTWVRIRAAGADPAALLADDDSHRALALAGDLFRTEATSTNVADLVMAIAGYR
jgi:hydroxypyruvate reductase